MLGPKVDIPWARSLGATAVMLLLLLGSLAMMLYGGLALAAGRQSPIYYLLIAAGLIMLILTIRFAPRILDKMQRFLTHYTGSD